MTATTIYSGDASNGASITNGNDGTMVVQVGPNGAKVNALSLSVAGLPTFDQLAKSIGATGYITLPGGLIVQWGTTTSSGTSSGNISQGFPITFPNAVFRVITTIIAGAFNGAVSLNTQTTTGFTATAYTANTAAITTAVPVNWIALGN